MPVRKYVFAKVPGVVVWAALLCSCAVVPFRDTANGPETSRQPGAMPAGALVRYTEEREAGSRYIVGEALARLMVDFMQGRELPAAIDADGSVPVARGA